MKTNQLAPDPRGTQPIAWAAHDTPSRGEILAMDAQQPDKLHSLAQEPVECRLNPRSPTVHTWLLSSFDIVPAPSRLRPGPFGGG